MEDFKKPLLFAADFLAVLVPVMINVEMAMQYSCLYGTMPALQDGKDEGARG